LVIKKTWGQGRNFEKAKLGTVLKALNLIKLNIPTSFGDLKNRGEGGSCRANKLEAVLKSILGRELKQFQQSQSFFPKTPSLNPIQVWQSK
jgi:hypothetical protein